MSNAVNGRAAYTGAGIIRGIFAARPKLRPNRITSPRRIVITKIDPFTLEVIDAEARKWRVSRGEAIARLLRTVRQARAELAELATRISSLENRGV